MPSFGDIVGYSAGVTTAIGGGGAIVVAFSGYFGRIWAEKLMITEKAKHLKDLADMRRDTEHRLEQY